MKTGKLLWRLLMLAAALSFIAFLVVYPALPQEVPINYTLSGEVTAWGSRAHYLGLHCIAPLVALGLYCIPRADPRRHNFAHHRRAYGIISVVVVVALIAFPWVMALPVLGIGVRVDSALCLILGLMLVGLGNYMPQLRSNFFAGFRTPWALADERVWRKTHRLGGFVFVISGALLALGALAGGGLALVGLAAVLCGTAFVFVYSYLVYRKLPREDEHAEN